MYPSGSAPARKYGTPKMHKFSSSDTVLNSFIYRYFESCFPVAPDDYSYEDPFSLLLKLRMQIFPVNFLFPAM